METAVPAPPRLDEEPSTSTAGGVHREPSEADVPLHVWASKLGTVHVHGELAKPHPVHPPQHHDPHKLNYAKAAKEELHEIATKPHSVKLVGKHTGVMEWDKVNETLPSEAPGSAKHDAKEMVEGWF